MRRPAQIVGRVVVLAAAAVVAVGFASFASAQPASFFKPGVPDFDQQNAALGMGGKFHCSPTAAANSLYWFEKNQGLDVFSNAYAAAAGGSHVQLINDLGGRMSTNGGTWNDNMVKGYRSYLRSANNQSFRQFDVKFDGTKYFRGYTVGQHSATVGLDWIKSELAFGEDVTLTVDWYRENVAGGTWTSLNGAHSITLDGYTASAGAGNASTSSLLIRDPWYAEGIIERDPESVAANRLMYEYSTGSARLRAEVVAAISVSPKPFFLVIDGFIDTFGNEYLNTPQPTCTDCLYSSVYPDYFSLGLDLQNVNNSLNPLNNDQGHVQIVDATNTGIVVDFDETGLLNVTQLRNGNPTTAVFSDNEVQLGYDFTGNVVTELFIDNEVFCFASVGH